MVMVIVGMVMVVMVAVMAVVVGYQLEMTTDFGELKTCLRLCKRGQHNSSAYLVKDNEKRV